MVSCSESFWEETIYTSSDVSLTRCFVYVSGENIELAKAEVAALSRILSSDLKLFWMGRLGILEGANDISRFILDRAALTHRAGRILYETDSLESLIETVPRDFWMNKLDSNDTFNVKTLSINTEHSLDERLLVERELGTHIKTTTGARVSLRNANYQVLVILSDTKVLVCKSTDSQLRSELRKRSPGKKSFFHPSMMNSSLARVMCNLAEIKADDIVLDPFCGGGGILCEASYLGAFSLGLDLNWKLLQGAKKNLEEIGSRYSILQADAQALPIKSVDCIVTDPPYGRSSSTRGVRSTALVEEVLKRLDSIIQSKGEHVCICGSTEMSLPQLIRNYGLHIGQDLRIRVHSGLVREIVTIIL